MLAALFAPLVAVAPADAVGADPVNRAVARLSPLEVSRALASLNGSPAWLKAARSEVASAQGDLGPGGPGDPGEQIDGPGFVPPVYSGGSTSDVGARKDAKPVRELIEERTATSDVTLNDDGTRTVRMYEEPRYYATAKGFEKVDNSIVTDEARQGGLRNAAGSWDVRFAPLAADGSGGVTLTKAGKAPARFFPEFAQIDPKSPIAPTAGTGDAADTVTYRDVVPGVDLVYEIHGDGVKEQIVLRSKTNLSSFPFAIDDVGLTEKADRPGVLVADDEAGAFIVHAPQVIDARGSPRARDESKATQTAAPRTPKAPNAAPTEPPSTTQPPASNTTVAPATTAQTPAAPERAAADVGKASRLTVAVDAAWLGSLMTEDFPVIIDPTITDSGGDRQTFNYNTTYGTNWSPGLNAYTYSFAGGEFYSGNMEYWRSFLKLNGYSAAFGGTVTDAHIDVTEQWGNSNTNTVKVYKATTNTTSSWNFSAVDATLQGSTTFQWSGAIDVTPLVQSWVAGSLSNQTIVFVGEENPSVKTKKAFSAVMSVTYSTSGAPPAATLHPAPPDGTVGVSDTPTLSVDAVTDPNPGDTVSYQFQLSTVSDFSTIALSSSWLSSPSYSVPSGTFVGTSDYYWRVLSKDNHGNTTTPAGGFRYKRSATALGVDGFGGYLGGANTLVGNYVFTETDVQVASVGPSLSLARTFNSLDPRDGPFGRGFSSNAFMSWAQVGTNIEITYPDGRRETFTPNGLGGWNPPPGYVAKLVGTTSTVFTLTAGDGTTQTFAASTPGNMLTSFKDAFGHELKIDYSSYLSTGAIKLKDMTSGREIRLSTAGTSPNFRITQAQTDNPVVPASPYTWTYTYDTTTFPGSPRLTSVCDARGGSYCRTYEWYGTGAGTGVAGNLKKVIDAKGQVDVELSYGVTGRVTFTKNALGDQKAFVYNQLGASPHTITTEVTDERSKKTTHKYSPAGQLTSQWAPGAMTGTAYTYDPITQMRTGVTDANTQNGAIVYDAGLRVIKTTNAVGAKTYTVYDDAGNAMKECDGRSADTNADNVPDADTYCTISSYGTTTAERAKRLIRTKQTPASGTESWSYTVGTEAAYSGGGTVPAGLVLTHTSPLGLVTTYQYNAKGDLLRMTDNSTAGVPTRYEAESAANFMDFGTDIPGYSGTGFIKWGDFDTSYATFTVTAPAAGTYTATVRYMTSSTTALRELKVNGTIITNTQAFPTTAWAEWKTVDIPVTLTSGSNTISLTYTSSTGSMNDAYYDYLDLTGSSGLDRRNTYDGLGRLLTTSDVSDTFPSGVTSTLTYDQVGRRLTVAGPAVQNRVSTTTHQSRTTNTFDANGNLTQVVESDVVGGDTSRTTTTDYDTLDRPYQSTNAEGGVTKRQYDAAGNVVLSRDANLHWLRTTYNDDNLPTKVEMLGATATPLTAPGTTISQTEYDSVGQPTAQIDPAGHRVETTYDTAGRVSTVVAKSYQLDPGVSTARDVLLKRNTYNGAGLVTKLEEGGIPSGTPLKTTNTTYDAAGRATGGSVDASNKSISLTLNAAGQPTVQTVTQTGVQTGGVTTAETRTSYDIAGRKTSQTVENGSADLLTTYLYDTRGATIGVVPPAGNASGATPADFKVTYLNDELGRTYRTKAPSVPTESGGGSPSATQPQVDAGWNTFGDLTHTKDERSNVTSTSYDRLGRSTGISYPAYTAPGGSPVTPAETYTYDANGNLTAQTDRRGYTSDYTFDDYNRPVTQTDPLLAGQVTRGVTSLEYDAIGNKTASVDPTGARTEFGYDTLSRPRFQKQIVRSVTVTPQLGAAGPQTPQTLSAGNYTTWSESDDLGRQVKTTSAEGVTSTNTYNTLDQVTTVTDTDSKATTATFDVLGNPVRVTDPLGRQVRYVYDQAGRKTETQTWASSSAPAYTTRSTVAYDAASNVATTTSGSGNTQTYTYDGLNRLITAAQPANGFTTLTATYGYDAAGNLTRTRDARANQPPTTKIAEDWTNTETSAWAALWTASSAGTGAATDITTPSGGTSPAGHLKTGSTSGNYARAVADSSSSHTDAQATLTVRTGTTISSETAKVFIRSSGSWGTNAGQTSNQTTGYYLSLNLGSNTVGFRETSTTSGTTSDAALGSTASLTFAASTTYRVRVQIIGTALKAKVWADGTTEPSSWTLSTTDSTLASGRAAISLVNSTGANREIWVDEYTLSDPIPASNSTAYDTITTYNTMGLVENTVEPSTTAHTSTTDRTWTLVYDAGGLVTQDRQPGSNTISYTYDTMGRLTGQSSGAAARSFTYDKTGRVTGIGHPSGTEALVWSDRNLLVGAAGPAGNLIATFDGDGRLTGRSDGAGYGTFTYTNQNELATTYDPTTGGTSTYTYNDASQPTRVDYGAVGSSPYRTFTYDAIGRKSTDTLKNTGGTTKMSSTFTYNADSNLTQEVISMPGAGNSAEGTNDYSYDTAGRLTAFKRTSGSTVVQTSYRYDPAGNRTNKTQNGVASNWTYDQRNRLTTGPDGTYTWDARGNLDKITNSSSVVILDTTFDGLNRLTGAVTTATTLSYTYDSLDRVATRNSTAFNYSGQAMDPVSIGTVSYGRTPDGALTGVKNGAAAATAQLNAHGDLRALIDTAGALTDTNLYEPEGKVLQATGSTGAQLGYQGDYTDPDTTDVWMGARWYSPNSATFRNRDTVRGELAAPTSLNRYTYAANNPITNYDPTGRYHCNVFADDTGACVQYVDDVGDACGTDGTLTFLGCWEHEGVVCGIGATWDGLGNTDDHCIVRCNADCFAAITAEQASERQAVDDYLAALAAQQQAEVDTYLAALATQQQQVDEYLAGLAAQQEADTAAYLASLAVDQQHVDEYLASLESSRVATESETCIAAGHVGWSETYGCIDNYDTGWDPNSIGFSGDREPTLVGPVPPTSYVINVTQVENTPGGGSYWGEGACHVASVAGLPISVPNTLAEAISAGMSAQSFYSMAKLLADGGEGVLFIAKVESGALGLVPLAGATLGEAACLGEAEPPGKRADPYDVNPAYNNFSTGCDYINPAGSPQYGIIPSGNTPYC